MARKKPRNKQAKDVTIDSNGNVLRSRTRGGKASEIRSATAIGSPISGGRSTSAKVRASKPKDPSSTTGMTAAQRANKASTRTEDIIAASGSNFDLGGVAGVRTRNSYGAPIKRESLATENKGGRPSDEQEVLKAMQKRAEAPTTAGTHFLCMSCYSLTPNHRASGSNAQGTVCNDCV